MVVFYSEDDELEEKGRTEIQKSTNCPDFITTFNVNYSFESQGNFRFDLYSMKNSNIESLLRQTHLGSARLNIHEIVCADNNKVTKPLDKKGTITVFYEELAYSSHKISLKLGISSKKSKGIYCLRLFRTGFNRNIPIYVTEGHKNIPCRNF